MTVKFEIAAENQLGARDPLRRPWSTPRVIKSELRDTKAKFSMSGDGEKHTSGSFSYSTVIS